MKKIVLYIFVSLCFSSYAQESELLIQTGPNFGWLSGDGEFFSSGNQFPLFGWTFGAGALLPLNWNFVPCDGGFFFSPKFMWMQGGQGNRYENTSWGLRNNYIGAATTLGYSYPTSPNQNVSLELGPSFNYWASAKDFYKTQDEKQTDKVDLSNNDNVNRGYVGLALEGNYEWNISRLKFSTGIRADFGLSSIESYKNLDGSKTRIKPNNVSIVFGVSIPFSNLLGKNSGSTTLINLVPTLLTTETTYKKVIISYRNARMYRDKAFFTDDQDSSKRYANEALFWEKKAEELMAQGVNEWNNGDTSGVGPTSANSLEMLLTNIKEDSQQLLDSVWTSKYSEDAVTTRWPLPKPGLTIVFPKDTIFSYLPKDSLMVNYPFTYTDPEYGFGGLYTGYKGKYNSVDTLSYGSGWEYLDSLDGDDPRDTGRAITYGEEMDPPELTWKGVFEPSQGVWQDDYSFEDQYSKQLTKVSDYEYNAELELVANRWTSIFGDRDRGRGIIWIEGTSNYNQWGWVKFRLKVIQGGRERIIWTQPKPQSRLPVYGGTGAQDTWKTFLSDSETGPIPETFTMKAGKYTLVLEVLRENNEPTGIELRVNGNVAETQPSPLSIVPMSISKNPSSTQNNALVQRARTLATELEAYFNLKLPIPLNSARVYDMPLQTYQLEDLNFMYDLKAAVSPFTLHDIRRDKLKAQFLDMYATAGQLNGNKTIMLLSVDDYALLNGGLIENSAAYASHDKFMVMKSDKGVTTATHEYIHTLPFSFADKRMSQKCHLNYHNSNDKNYAHGTDITGNSINIYRNYRSIMGPAFGDRTHITQCSWWHLQNHFKADPDPKLYLVRGFIVNGEQAAGVMANTYEIMGVDDLLQDDLNGSWGIRLKNKKRETIGTYPFTPQWVNSEGDTSVLIAYNHRIPRMTGTAVLELVGPQGVLDSQIVSKSSPKLRVLKPQKNAAVHKDNNNVRVEWEGTDADGDTLSYLVYYSPDGESWRLISHDKQSTHVDINVPGYPSGPQIRIIATDGVRSKEKTIKFFVVKPE